MADGAAKKKTTRKKTTRKKAPEPRGLEARRLASASPPAAVTKLVASIEDDGGTVLATYRDPLGENWQVLAGLPIDAVVPTPFQRNLSDTHVKRLSEAIDKIDRFLDPVIAVRWEEGVYWTPNGSHRLASMKNLGARSIVALIVPEIEVAYRILALNTEKAHNVRERALEVIRLAEALCELDPRPEREFALEFEEPSLLTLGACYQEKGRFSGGAYHPVLKRVEAFLGSKLPKAVEVRRERAARLLELDEVVIETVAALKDKGFDSPYLKAFVIARINPLRFQRGARSTFDETLDKMLASARRFDPSKIKADQVARAAGPPAE